MNAALSQTLRGEILERGSMARHTTWRTGGPARIYRPADIADLQAFLAGLAYDEPVHFVGLGSNLLVRDGGVPGWVVLTNGTLAGLAQSAEFEVRAEAGVPCAKVARFCMQRGLAGGEFLAGIPGNMGGALAMNAGAFGGETWERVTAVETVDRNGRLHRRTPGEYEIAYRHVRGPAEECFVAVTLGLTEGDPEAMRERVRELLARRAATQPMGKPSCGSVFRNPPGDHAARLIEACGLKGAREGGAQVSEKHANFIINAGEATAADIERLIARVQAEVEQRMGVRLQPEVRIIGEEVCA